MQITIPDSAVDVLQQRAEQAGFASVDEYVLAMVLPTTEPVEESRKATENGQPESGKSFYDAAVESGLIGGGSDYPPDLSTNPKYMEGFGE